MLFGLFTLFVAVTISAVAAYYSIVGLTAIFSAAVLPIIIMGGALEVGKVTAAVWLKLNWDRAKWTYKLYLVPAVALLMLLTSMGIFGFLSKAHSDQALVSGDIGAKIVLIDEKIAIERSNIKDAQEVIKQLDAAVNGVIATGDQEFKRKDGSTFVRSAAERSLQIRRSQAKDRERLTKEIDASQNRILKLQEEAAPIRAENRKVEAEVGPIKYIAALIYGDNPDQNILEKSVRWVIIVIVAVFDPLALVLILAAQQSIRWHKEDQEKIDEDDEQGVEDFFKRGRIHAQLLDREEEDRKAAEANALLAEVEKPQPEFIPPEVVPPSDPTVNCFKCGTVLENAPGIGPFCPNKNCDVVDGPFLREDSGQLPAVPAEEPEDTRSMLEKHPYLNKPFSHFTNLKPMVYKEQPQYEQDDGPLTDEQIEQVKETAVESRKKEIEPAPEKFERLDGGYVRADDKTMSDQVFVEYYPNHVHLLADNEGTPSYSDFGTIFPIAPVKGQLFLRVDYTPNKLFKHNGYKWIEVDKAKTDSYAYDDKYIDFIIEKLKSGEYDFDQLSASEQELVEEKLNKLNDNT